MACRFWSAPAIIWIEASRAAEAQRHSQRISDAQRSQIATPLDGLGLPDSGWIARKPVYKSPGWSNGFPFTKRDSIRGLVVG